MRSKYFLSIQGSYSTSEALLYKDNKIVQSTDIILARASSALVPAIDALLTEEGINLSNLEFIALDAGPGAFTSTRVTVVTANALSFASGLGLLGINGLKALAADVKKQQETFIKKQNVGLICALLNAYNNEVYGYVTSCNEAKVVLDCTCLNIEVFLNELKSKIGNQKILFTGNGSQMHSEEITRILVEKAIFEKIITPHCSASAVANLAMQKVASGEKPSSKVLPIYMKAGMSTPSPKKTC
ncbi:tRNA (adenosine(37)-N6)-threonylcarbamoyltransferase complex dimerization subunit type 1 TsaB [Candidatus Dependentiae bacterium]